MVDIVLTDPSKEFLLGIEFSNGSEYEDGYNLIVIGFLFFEVVIVF